MAGRKSHHKPQQQQPQHSQPPPPTQQQHATNENDQSVEHVQPDEAEDFIQERSLTVSSSSSASNAQPLKTAPPRPTTTTTTTTSASLSSSGGAQGSSGRSWTALFAGAGAASSISANTASSASSSSSSSASSSAATRSTAVAAASPLSASSSASSSLLSASTSMTGLPLSRSASSSSSNSNAHPPLSSPSPSPRFTQSGSPMHDPLTTEKQQLILQLKFALQECLARFAINQQEPLKSEPAVVHLTSAIESIFVHGFRPGLKSKMLNVKEAFQSLHVDKHDLVMQFPPRSPFWEFVVQFTRKAAVSELTSIRVLTTDIGRSRAWVRLALNEFSLENYLRFICSESNSKLLRSYYSPTAIMLDGERRDTICMLIASLDTVSFQIALNDPSLNTWCEETHLSAPAPLHSLAHTGGAATTKKPSQPATPSTPSIAMSDLPESAHQSPSLTHDTSFDRIDSPERELTTTDVEPSDVGADEGVESEQQVVDDSSRLAEPSNAPPSNEQPDSPILAEEPVLADEPILADEPTPTEEPTFDSPVGSPPNATTRSPVTSLSPAIGESSNGLDNDEMASFFVSKKRSKSRKQAKVPQITQLHAPPPAPESPSKRASTDSQSPAATDDGVSGARKSSFSSSTTAAPSSEPATMTARMSSALSSFAATVVPSVYATQPAPPAQHASPQPTPARAFVSFNRKAAAAEQAEQLSSFTVAPMVVLDASLAFGPLIVHDGPQPESTDAATLQAPAGEKPSSTPDLEALLKLPSSHPLADLQPETSEHDRKTTPEDDDDNEDVAESKPTPAAELLAHVPLVPKSPIKDFEDYGSLLSRHVNVSSPIAGVLSPAVSPDSPVPDADDSHDPSVAKTDEKATEPELPDQLDSPDSPDSPHSPPELQSSAKPDNESSEPPVPEDRAAIVDVNQSNHAHDPVPIDEASVATQAPEPIAASSAPVSERPSTPPEDESDATAVRNELYAKPNTTRNELYTGGHLDHPTSSELSAPPNPFASEAEIQRLTAEYEASLDASARRVDRPTTTQARLGALTASLVAASMTARQLAFSASANAVAASSMLASSAVDGISSYLRAAKISIGQSSSLFSHYQQTRSLKETPKSAAHTADDSDGEFEFVMNSLEGEDDLVAVSYREENDHAFLALLSLIYELGAERGLDSQLYKCHGCKSPIGMVFGPYRICSYDGRYYCQSCHHNDLRIIPARIVHNWDFSKYAVSRVARDFLDYMGPSPVFDIQLINPLLYGLVEELQEVKSLRQRLLAIRNVVSGCRLYDSEGLPSSHEAPSTDNADVLPEDADAQDGGVQPSAAAAAAAGSWISSWTSGFAPPASRQAASRQQSTALAPQSSQQAGSGGAGVKPGKLGNSNPLRKLLYPRDHLLDDNVDLYSGDDLVQLHAGTLTPLLRKAIATALHHVANCSECQAKGMNCAICRGPDRLFPFDTDTVGCKGCPALFHRSCWMVRVGACPRCGRSHSRGWSSGSQALGFERQRPGQSDEHVLAASTALEQMANAVADM
ncbi:hypothetical protein CAOG_07041 [Capsaspora owczarzaki ATCC 30864]|uniref:RUN domain-containing protein n=1 Tax=Capsaspora owczarzaki (strain ATCC 30864) TaxID=595528 RepID=A0A0D2X4W5_CAPO3|nr:hypothetical protein CAOG_07041 [Capsaspora owczarzaki ATCC 30864]KJE96769.1 hypothetical protein CAOG_007041 [Capsaspora owczarzaki ATCC 30864]|eukprot:XP_004343765.2 hypothetical protein CAOG_07041 [Capsaspora owczarzaki ATCC 30864]